ncbi:MAG: methionine--tRNA ligase subunit beta [Candidatus Omnitrophica bacterium]|nr:methionine--tRNA ligase subunit beta [Candidatus Omnitrophota bacterium]
MVSLDVFKELEIRIAKILEVQDHPQADKLYVLKIDLGKNQKQIVAGIKSSYSKEELLGKQIVVIDNLEPAIIRGIKSEGMLLAAEDINGPVLVIPQREVKLGSKVK